MSNGLYPNKKKWKNSALNCEAYNTFCSVGSDHRVVTAKIRLSLRQSKPSGKKKIRYNWNKLLKDNNIKDMYTVEVCNRYQALQDLHGNEDANQMYENIMTAHEKAAEIRSNQCTCEGQDKATRSVGK